MRVGLIDVDGHNFPNLALMKISAYHKQRGDSVEMSVPIMPYDIVYQAKVFDETYTEDIGYFPLADKVIKGGTGYFKRDKDGIGYVYVDGKWINIGNKHSFSNGVETYTEFLTDTIEHMYPDYSLYPTLTKDTAFGFLTRGCPRACKFCIVAGKEGRKSYKVADLSEFHRGQKFIELLDPNILACKDHIDLLKQLVESKAYVNFNQGLDIRCINEDNVALINKLKLKNIHFAWDNAKDDLTPYFERYKKLAKHKPHGDYGTV